MFSGITEALDNAIPGHGSKMSEVSEFIDRIFEILSMRGRGPGFINAQYASIMDFLLMVRTDCRICTTPMSGKWWLWG